MDLFYDSASIVLFIAVAGGAITLIMGSVQGVKFVGGFITGVKNASGGLKQKAQDRAQQTKFFQRRQMAKDFKTSERKRAGTEDFAERVQNSSRWRRRAAGIGNTEGQTRALQNAQDTLRRFRHDEAERASKDLARQGFEGDTDFMGIARAGVGGTYTSTRTGQTIQVTEATQQAAVNSLVQQGRVRPLRNLEGELMGRDPVTGLDVVNPAAAGTGGRRGPAGQPTQAIHEVLDRAYEEYGGKVAEKAADMAPSRRASGGSAAFTDLKAEDVVSWHETTVDAAERYYADPARAGATAVDDRNQMLRSFVAAIKEPSLRGKIGPTQIQALQRAIASNPGSLSTADVKVVSDRAAELGV
jgi:hypothetical protein